MADATIEDPKLPTQAGKELGVSGTYIFGGYISGEEYNRDLQGKYALQVYDTMRRSDATVHAALIAVKNPIIGAMWDIEPASDDDVDIEIANFVKRELFKRKISFQDVTREGLTCLDFGHSLLEVVYEVTEFNGKVRIGLAKLASRKQRSILKWAIGPKNDEPGITQITPTAGLIEIPRNKLVYIVNEREGENYQGISLLRFAYKPWKIKDALELVNAIALERMAIGIPIVKKDATNQVTVSDQDMKTLRAALANIRANENSYIESPIGMVIEMLDMKSQTTKDVLPTITYQNTQITLSVLAQFLMLGQAGSSGSRAVSADHSSLFVKSLEAVARTLQQPFQTDVVNRLVDMNYSNLQNGYPKLVFSEVSDDDVAAFAEAVSKLMTAKALTADPDVENRVRNVLNLPELREDDYDNYDANHAPIAPVMPSPDTTTPTVTPKDDGKTVDDMKKTMPKDGKTMSDAIADAKVIQARLLAHILED